MMFSTTAFACLALAAAATQVSAHGHVVSPVPRRAGQNLLDVCGEQQWRYLSGFNNGNDADGVFRDPSQDVPAPKPECNYLLCRGSQLEDNSTVWNWPAGTQVPMLVTIRVDHAGSANVSITRTKDMSKVALLKVWDGNALVVAGQPAYGSSKSTAKPNLLPSDQWNFTVTIPDVGDNCRNVGDCVVEWYWYGAMGIVGSKKPQEYENCIDFVQNSAVAFPSGSANMTGAAALAAQKLVGTAASSSNSTVPLPAVAAVNVTAATTPATSEAAVESDCEDEATATGMVPASTEASDCSDDESSSAAAPVPTPMVAAVDSVSPVADTPAVVSAATPVINAMPAVAAVSSPAVFSTAVSSPATQSVAMAVPTNAYIPNAGGSSASMVAASAGLLVGALSLNAFMMM